MPLIDMSEIFQMTNVGDHIDGTDVYQSNPNLLDNSYFVGGGSQLGDDIFPINQRGLLNYGAGYTIDRWKLSSGGTLVFTNDGISIDGLFFQKKVIDFTVGETYTLSRQTTDGNVVSVTGVVPSNEGWMIGGQTFGVYFRPSTKVCDIQIWGTYLLKAVKLEKGTVSTLANDVPPDYGTELLKCQRYFFRVTTAGAYSVVGNGFATSTSATSILIPTPITMRATPTVAVTNVGSIQLIGNGAARVVTSVSMRDKTQNGVLINAAVSGSNLTASQAYSLTFADTSPILDFSADL